MHDATISASARADPGAGRRNLGKLLPEPIYTRINSQLGHYLGVSRFPRTGRADARLIYLQTSATVHRRQPAAIRRALEVFFALTIISRRGLAVRARAAEPARGGSGNQAADHAADQEIDAHKRTDAELQRAKEVAESANLAKSRYVVGLSMTAGRR